LASIVRFSRGRQVRYGLLDGGSVFELVGDVFGQFEQGQYVAEYEQLTILSPCAPTKIVGVGLNYRSHVEEMGLQVPDAPILFLKPPSSVIGPRGEIVFPASSNELAFGAELALVLKRRAKAVSPSEAVEHLLGYTCGNDVTARDLARTDASTTRGKCFDTFCPLGPCIATGLDAGSLGITSRLNGRTYQHAKTADMLFSIGELVSFISHVMTLEPGDVVLTGTPKGAGEVMVGDAIEIEIEGVGTLVNTVVSPR
jgi:2-keto-4-pentenoate hydratase/2-oxohepta-3-ene-1,7-dioic acid hydratase in catechol pathway